MVFQSDGVDGRFQDCELILGCGRDLEAELIEDGIELIRGFFRGAAAHRLCDLPEDILQEVFASRVDAEMSVFEHPREKDSVAKRGRVTMRTTEQARDLAKKEFSPFVLRFYL